jgi:hypothetical protein
MGSEFDWREKIVIDKEFKYREKIVIDNANQRTVSYCAAGRETIVTDTDIGRTIIQKPRKYNLSSIIFHTIIFSLLGIPAYVALTVKEDGVLIFPEGQICLIFPICFALLFIFANRKTITVRIENNTIYQIVRKGNKIISEEEVELSKVTGTIRRFSTDTVSIEEIEYSLGESRHEITYEEGMFEANKLGHGNKTFICLDILGELEGREITLMELKFYDSTTTGAAWYACKKVEQELIWLGVQATSDLSDSIRTVASESSFTATQVGENNKTPSDNLMRQRESKGSL